MILETLQLAVDVLFVATLTAAGLLALYGPTDAR